MVRGVWGQGIIDLVQMESCEVGSNCYTDPCNAPFFFFFFSLSEAKETASRYGWLRPKDDFVNLITDFDLDAVNIDT